MRTKLFQIFLYAALGRIVPFSEFSCIVDLYLFHRRSKYVGEKLCIYMVYVSVSHARSYLNILLEHIITCLILDLDFSSHHQSSVFGWGVQRLEGQLLGQYISDLKGSVVFILKSHIVIDASDLQ